MIFDVYVQVFLRGGYVQLWIFIDKGRNKKSGDALITTEDLIVNKYPSKHVMY